MTKWIVGLLLLANLALFGWMRWGATLTVDPGAPAVQAALNADKVRLLEYLPASAAEPASSAAPGLTLTLSPAQAAPAPASAPAPVLSQAPAASAASSVTPSVPAPPPAMAKKTAPKISTCAEWGEFSGSDLGRAQQALAALNLGGRLTQRGVEQDHGYWVYIPPLKNRAEVEKKIAQLKQRGVDDYFVVQEAGEWQNAISLGVFRTEEAAQKFLATLRTRQVRSARVGERMSKLRFTVFVMKGLDAGTMGRIEALRKRFPDGELKVSACGN
jgi:hypothetical protein